MSRELGMSGRQIVVLGVAESTVSRLLTNPTSCFDKLSISGSPPRISNIFPLTLSLSKGVLEVCQHPVSRALAAGRDRLAMAYAPSAR
jgi:hypothetical protein